MVKEMCVVWYFQAVEVVNFEAARVVEEVECP
jgi:hypothetical protein